MSAAARSWVLPVLAVTTWAWLLVSTPGLPEPVQAGVVDGEVEVREDPERFGVAVRLVVRHDGVDLEAWARGGASRVLERRQVGELIEVSGPVRPMDADWRLRQGVRGRLEVRDTGAWRHGGWVSRGANALRRTLAEGARAMDGDDAALYVGLLLGDRRGHDTLTEDAFAGSGLSHVLAVSGSNVAFVLVLAGPVLRRLRFGGRLAGTLAVVMFFAVVTRLEPSVLRAATMAGIGACAVTLGWQAASRNVLAAAVVCLLLIDRSLATSLGFQLSVAASVGIVALAGPLATRLPGPRWFAESLSVTTAAQLAVAPLLLPIAGGLPVASLPANLLAVPVTGPVMVWGVPAGLVAGVAGGDSAVAAWLHTPTSWMVTWIDAVARAGASAPLGTLGPLHLVVVAIAVLVVAGARRTAWRGVAGVIAAVALCVPAGAAAWQRPESGHLGTGADLHAGGGAVVLVIGSDVRADLLLEGLRGENVGRIDVLVCLSGDARAAEAASVVAARYDPRLILAPDGHRVRGGSVPPVGTTVTVGSLAIVVSANAPQLEVTVEPVTRARDPPGRPGCESVCARTTAEPLR